MSKTIRVDRIVKELRCKRCGGVIIKHGPESQRLLKCAMCNRTFIHEHVLEYCEVIS